MQVKTKSTLYGKYSLYSLRVGSAERRVRERGERRQRILAAARDLFIEQGYASVSIRKIAERAEYSPMALYQYFSTKEQLLATICKETFEKLTCELKRLEAEPGDPITMLKRGLHLYVNFGIAHPHDYRLTFMMPPPQPEDRMEKAGEDAFDTLRRGVGRCVAQGTLAVAVEEASQALWAAIHGTRRFTLRFPAVGARSGSADCVGDRRDDFRSAG